jgi:aminopeptidase YwaD
MMKRSIGILLIGICTSTCLAQDVAVARRTIDTLTSEYFWGRGYTNNGLLKTADYLVAEFRHYGLKPLSGKSYKQEFSYPVNAFPGKMQVAINGVELIPGTDFIITPNSRGTKSKGKLVEQDSSHFMDAGNMVIVSLESKLTWSVAPTPDDHTTIQVLRNSLKDKPVSFNVSIENKALDHFTTANVCGLVNGTRQPDSLIVITAHYDHLGGMGNETYFPGANDNASGVALLLNLAKHYASNPPPYSIAFICFSGEEAGLIGSKFFSEHPLINLANVRFLVNIDLAGTGDEGITLRYSKKSFPFSKKSIQPTTISFRLNHAARRPTATTTGLLKRVSPHSLSTHWVESRLITMCLMLQRRYR